MQQVAAIVAATGCNDSWTVPCIHCHSAVCFASNDDSNVNCRVL